MKPSLEILMMRWFQGEASEAEVRALEAALLEHPEWREKFRKEANLEVLLRDEALDASLLAWQETDLNAPSKVSVRSASIRKKSPLWWAISAFSCFSVGWGVHWLTREASPWSLVSAPIAEAEKAEKVEPVEAEAFPDETAILTKTIHAKWSPLGQDPIPGDSLRAGMYLLKEGYAQIEFYDGASVLLEAPAHLELIDSNRSKLHQGRIRVHIPNPAHGFQLEVKGGRIASGLGEFGVNLDEGLGLEEYYVFLGSAQVSHATQESQRLHAGQVFLANEGAILAIDSLDTSRFISLDGFEQSQFQRANLRFDQWKNWSSQAKQDHRLLAFFPFGRKSLGERELANSAEWAPTHCNGGIVGARWTQGRWPDKDALEFRRPGDRVRLELEGKYDHITICCWVKVDSLDREYNGILLTDGFEKGELHWQVAKDGRVMLSIADEPQAGKAHSAEHFYSPVVFSKHRLGVWHHLAVSYDRTTGEVVHFVDGKRVSRSVASKDFSKPSIVFGRCELGNWGKPVKGLPEPTRNLNGCLDEFSIYTTALSQTEVAQLFEAGRLD